MAHKAKSIAMQPSPADLRASPAAPRAFDRDAGRRRIAKGTHRVALGEAADDLVLTAEDASEKIVWTVKEEGHIQNLNRER
jgi:hypothetical protein